MGRQIRVVGMDPSMSNWGFAIATFDLDTNKVVQVEKVGVIKPVLPTGKQVRQNSKDLVASEQLSSKAMEAVSQAKAVFVEVPVGSQSARAMASYGICVGILGAMRAAGTPFFEVTPTEVKVQATGKATATKQDMIDWATKQHPEANWPTYTRGGQIHVTADKAEHMADAVGALYAGLHGSQFKQLLPLMKENHANHPETTTN